MAASTVICCSRLRSFFAGRFGFYILLLLAAYPPFASVLATPATLPRFWIFMYRVSPFTYLVSGMLATGVANSKLICSPIELAVFNPPSGQTCDEYMSSYISSVGGSVYNPNATSGCEFCSATSTNSFLKALDISYSDRWRNFGLMWIYITVNIVGCILIYWLARVPKKRTKKQKAG